MPPLKGLITALAVVASTAYAQGGTDMGGSDEMGPAAFMWPKDRVWSAAMDNTAPCGSVTGAGNRTDYPLRTFTPLAFKKYRSNSVLKKTQRSHSSSKMNPTTLNSPSPTSKVHTPYLPSLPPILTHTDPKSNADFNTLISPELFKALARGHTCIPVSDAPPSVAAGANATLQIKYIADFDKPENQTFYACADVRFVALSDMKEGVPCFDQTRPAADDDDDDKEDSSESPHGSSGKDKAKSGLSGGAIAGIVVGAVAGLALLGLAAFLVYRRKARRSAAARQAQSARGVAWEDQPPKNSQSESSVRMNNL
jgi:hypothetical protein